MLIVSFLLDGMDGIVWVCLCRHSSEHGLCMLISLTQPIFLYICCTLLCLLPPYEIYLTNLMSGNHFEGFGNKLQIQPSNAKFKVRIERNSLSNNYCIFMLVDRFISPTVDMVFLGMDSQFLFISNQLEIILTLRQTCLKALIDHTMPPTSCK